MSTHPAELDDAGRVLVERAVRQVLASVPPNWAQLHLECGPQDVVSAYVGSPGASSQWLAVPPDASDLLIECLHTAVGAGVGRLVVDCYPDGRLSARTETVPHAMVGAPTSVPPTPAIPVWPKRILAAFTVACLVAAAAVFAVGWRWSDPPDADIALLAPPSPRQQEAFDVLTKWYQAMSAHDVAAADALKCSNLFGPPLNEYEAMVGNYQPGRDYVEAIVDFQDNETQVSAKVLYRTFPLTDKAKADAEVQQQSGTGVSHRLISLIEEDGQLKVCGGE